MTRIIEYRRVITPTVLELRVFRALHGDVLGCVISDQVILDETTMEQVSVPVA
ncbi:MAG: hypothetical protein ABR953_15055 [Candidatus Acidiferrales bacterium]|jgi:hypothetical protein